MFIKKPKRSKPLIMKIDKSKLRIIEKPDTIPHEQIKLLLNEAHDAHSDIHFPTSNLSESVIRENLKSGGTVLVALYDGKLAGTITVGIDPKKKWYAKGKTASCLYLGVLPKYSRNGIASMLVSESIEWAKKNKVNTLIWSPASNNNASIQLAKKHGFGKADFYKISRLDHTTIRLINYFPPRRMMSILCYYYYIYRVPYP